MIFLKIKIFSLFFVQIFASLTLDKADIRVLDGSFGTCTVTILSSQPKSIDLDIHSTKDAKDVILQFMAFSAVDGNYNEIIESEKVSLCQMGNSSNPLVQLMFKEMAKIGNITEACPVVKGHYFVHGLTLKESDLPLPLPAGHFKLEVNGTGVSGDDQMIPIFELELVFTEAN